MHLASTTGAAPPPGRDFEFTALQEAHNYRTALQREFAPYLRGRVIEVGSGIGQFTRRLRALPAIESILAVEPDGEFCRALRQALPAQWIMQGTSDALRWDHPWNAIVSVNVLEHIEADRRELAAYNALLKAAAGRLCLFVPARPEIYAPLDRDFGHYRRYTRAELQAKLQEAGFQIERLHYFNAVGYAAWWFNFCLLKRRRFDVTSVRLFDRCLFPVTYWLESHLAHPPIGQSLLAIARAAK